MVGAGISGLATGILLARLGHRVSIIEQRANDGAMLGGGGGRTISIALSHRGFAALAALDPDMPARLRSLPMFGRMVHDERDLQSFTPYDEAGGRAIYAAQRATVHGLLVSIARREALLTLDFGIKCLSLCTDENLLMAQTRDGAARRIAFDALIAADGAGSMIRSSIDPLDQPSRLHHVYRELRMDPARTRDLRRDALHVWPNGDTMLVALPDEAGGFSATLFMPRAEGGRSSMDVTALLSRAFPFAQPRYFPDPSRHLQSTRDCPILTVRARRWQLAPNIVTIGDAAHAMAPFYGQGLNCALEDSVILAEIARNATGWPACFSTFASLRKPDTDVIVDLSDQNYQVMNGTAPEAPSVNAALRARYQAHAKMEFATLYELVAFTAMPYAAALARARLHETQLLAMLGQPSRHETDARAGTESLEVA